MKRVHNRFLAVTAAFTFAVAGAACDNTARGAKEDTAAATADAKEAGNAAKAEAKDEAAEARAEGRDAKGDVKRAAGEAGTAVGAAAETVDVKTALMADTSVDASDINVDTFHETKTVVLKGTVVTAAQKTEAGKIAAREAEGYRVDNQLTVRPRS